MTQQDTQPPAETLAEAIMALADDATLFAKWAGIAAHQDVKGEAIQRLFKAFAQDVIALTRRAGGDAIPAGEVEAFRRGAEAMQRKLADALRDHLNSRAAAIANGVTIPEYQA